jgi:hypothetical protein
MRADLDKSVEPLWRRCSRVTFVWCVAFWIGSQTESIRVISFVAETVYHANTAGMLASPMVLICLGLAIEFARQRPGQVMAARVPEPGKEWPSGRTADRFKVVIVLLMLAFMVASQVHFADQIQSSQVFVYDSRGAHNEEPEAHSLFALHSYEQGLDTYRLGDPKDGPTYLPSFQQWYMWILATLEIAGLLFYFGLIFRPRGQVLWHRLRTS